MNSQGTNQPIIIPHIPGALGIIYLIIGFLLLFLSKSLAVFLFFYFLYLIFILVSFDQYSLILNNPSIFRYGLRYGIYTLFTSLLSIFAAKFVSSNIGVNILTSLLVYGISVPAAFNLKKALTELSIALNHKLFNISGKLIFWGILIGPIVAIGYILLMIGSIAAFIGYILLMIGSIAWFIGYVIGHILLMVAFFTAPRIGIINNQFSNNPFLNQDVKFEFMLLAINPSANAFYQMLKLFHWTGYVIGWSIGRLTGKIPKNIAYSQSEITNSRSEIDACINFLKAGDYKKAIEAGKLAVQKYPENSIVYVCLGEAYYKVGELNLAYENMKKAESLTNNKEDLMHIYNKIGQILLDMGYLDDAILYFMKSLISAKELNNIDMQASILNNIANVYYSKGELDKALSYYEESLNLQTNEKDKAVTYNNIANIYSGKGDYQKAIQYFQKAIEIDEKYGDYHNASIHRLNLGGVYREMKDYENAEKFLSEGLEGAKKVGDKYGEAVGYWYFGNLYRDKGDKKTAKEYYTRAYNLFKSIGAEGYAQIVLNEMDILNEMKELDKLN
jgi:Tfp pilus assembly protein PilF